MTPNGTPSITEKNSASTASLAVIGMRGSDLLDRRLLRDVGVAEIAARQAADPLDVLHDDRPVEAELLVDLRLLAGIDDARRIEQDVGDVARHQPQHHEDQHRHPEQRQDHQQKAPDQIGPQSQPPIVKAGVVRAPHA